MRVMTQDGREFEGDTAEAVVAQMKQEDWSAPPKKAEYMAEVAERVQQMTGVPVRTTDAMTFLHDLEVADLCDVTYLSAEQAEAFNRISAPEQK